MRSENKPSGQKNRKGRSFIEQARRAQIIDAAIATIADVGFANASLARIAERAGISKGVISYHFAGKDELVQKVVDQIYTDVADSVVAEITEWTEAPTATAVLRTHILTVAAYMRDHREHLKALSEIFTGFRDPDGRSRYGVQSSDPIYDSLEAVYRTGQERGEFRPFDTRVMAVSQQAAIDHMFAYWENHPEHDLDAYARELADLFEHATRAIPPGS
ncbi:TetR/AcrR family transcriptional regulator [Marinactinospora thermotolerans]|uniref:Transcriptional regulator, TetR family n=1 Tax=Marinactinospora thermotolerans DSM 45154 TaxID=1122192 RepID=A0A1T4MU64_9ACTN|nr:TetR/AcrR family transcriptional regulator [Marinactinospora thermotolerans]SJZ70650.1 transcriptional regulator, TetR family [Marinactinospora thermotolerans DSM 45154]